MSETVLPTPRAIVLDLGDGRRFAGELTVTADARDVSLLLHDEGDDLDAVRGVARRLQQVGFSALALDLPGHGLSAGDLADLPAAIDAALAVLDPGRQRGRWLIACGRTVGQVLAEPIDVDGLVTIDAAVSPEAEIGDRWRRRPMLHIVDPTDSDADATAERLVTRHRAWALRTFVHRSDPQIHQQQATSLVSKFLLEQGEIRRRALGKVAV